MAVIKDTYGQPETTLASYDWYDLSTGTGYLNLYGIELSTAGGATYGLTTEPLFSDIGHQDYANAAGELNFDLDIEVPLTIEGVARINAPVSTANSFNMTLTFKIYRVDSASVEYQLGGSPTTAFSMNDLNYIAGVKIDIPLTRLKAGEKLRLSCINASTGDGAKILRWMFDPKNRDNALSTTFVSSQLILNLPIKL